MGAIFGRIGHKESDNGDIAFEKMRFQNMYRGAEAEKWTGSKGIMLGCCTPARDRNACLVVGEGENVIAVCEGEIYNASELLGINGEENLKSAGGNQFRYIPPLYKKYGYDFARRLNGVFSIALWDSLESTLLLIRDHLGSHSIFYRVHGSEVLFANTIWTIRSACHEDFKILPSSIDYFLSSVALSPPKTMYKGIFCVKPGHLVEIKNGHVKEHDYWQPGKICEDYQRSSDSFAEEIRSIFEDSVRIRASYQGDYAALLSGGVDTAAIAASLVHMNPGRGLDGFSINFSERSYDDTALQEQMYGRFAIRRNPILFNPSDFADALTAGVKHLDIPVNDVAYAGMFKAMEAVRKAGFSAVFEGEGSDEIFCTGHSQGELSIQAWLAIPIWLRKGLFRTFFPAMPMGAKLSDKVRRFVCRVGMLDHVRLSTWVPSFPPLFRRHLLSPDIPCTEDFYEDTRECLYSTQAHDAINKYQFILTRMFLANDLLYKNERMASANGLTNRTPFIDYRLVETAFRVPARLKIQPPSHASDGTKLIFKKAVNGLVPEGILNRKKKRGFSQPTAVWYRNELKNFAMDLLLSPTSRHRQYLNSSVVKSLLEDHLSGKANHDYHLNAIIVLELWLRQHSHQS